MTEKEFKIVVLPFCRKLYPMLKNILRDEVETQDALQEVMFKLWRKRKELAQCRNPQAYMVIMAKNHCYDVLKKKRPLRMDEQESGAYMNLQDTAVDSDVIEQYEHVRAVIEALPIKHREIIRLRDIDGFSYEEIKELTGLDIPHIRVILSRARQKVKLEIQKMYDYEDKRQTTGSILSRRNNA